MVYIHIRFFSNLLVLFFRILVDFITAYREFLGEHQMV